MREIRFRAWDRQTGTMIPEKSITFVFLQFTGLHDKNGREIYEGDIVIAEWHWTKPHVFEYPNDFYAIAEYALDDVLTVIGNIYENPELLEQEGE